MENVKVQIYAPDSKLLGTVYTDKDGLYTFQYKHGGKGAYFTVELPEYNIVNKVYVK